MDEERTATVTDVERLFDQHRPQVARPGGDDAAPAAEPDTDASADEHRDDEAEGTQPEPTPRPAPAALDRQDHGETAQPAPRPAPPSLYEPPARYRRPEQPSSRPEPAPPLTIHVTPEIIDPPEKAPLTPPPLPDPEEPPVVEAEEPSVVEAEEPAPAEERTPEGPGDAPSSDPGDADAEQVPSAPSEDATPVGTEAVRPAVVDVEEPDVEHDAVVASGLSAEDFGTVLAAVGNRRRGGVTDDDWLARAGLEPAAEDSGQTSFGFEPRSPASDTPYVPSTRELPLAARMRPRSLDEYVGHGHVVGEGTPLRALLDQGELTSVILWGPPGSGKTSLASVMSRHSTASWAELSAVAAGVRDVRKVIDEARTRLEASGRKTVLFLDEIHRFNKAQQDALLPAVENGWVILIGATTENPFFELNAPLMSRCKLVQLDPLDDGDIQAILRRALVDPARGFGGRVGLAPEAEKALIGIADGDARTALNALENAVLSAQGADSTGTVAVQIEHIADASANARYDKAGDLHYDLVSAFIKSLRGSDPDAAAYWLLRMLDAGEDPRFLARRMIIFASEDVGLADPSALPLAVAGFQALDRVGLPEARHTMVHVAIALAVAPKSNAVARALGDASRAAQQHPNALVPHHLRDAHFAGAAQLGHGEGYQYPHDHPDGFVAQQYLPDVLDGSRFYHPTGHGHEAEIASRLATLRDRIDSARQRWRSASAVGQAGHIQGIRRNKGSGS